MTRTRSSSPPACSAASEALARLERRLVACRRCPRLVAHREATAREKVARFREWAYWGRPVPGFGDPRARLLLVGLVSFFAARYRLTTTAWIFSNLWTVLLLFLLIVFQPEVRRVLQRVSPLKLLTGRPGENGRLPAQEIVAAVGKLSAGRTGALLVLPGEDPLGEFLKGGIPLDGRPHPGARIGQWLGDSRGHWEGETLVVETTNFADKTRYWWAQAWRASRPSLRLVERLTRIDERYTFPASS